MNTISWQDPMSGKQIGTTMSDIDNTQSASAENTERVYDSSALSDSISTSNLDEIKKNQKPATSQSMPDFDNMEEDFVDKRNVSDTRSAQIKRIVGETWVRIVLVIGAIIAFLFFVMFIRGWGEETIFVDNGASSSIRVNPNKTGKDNLNKQQAAYLMELKREEARKKAKAGESSAAIIELPRASIDNVNMAEDSEVANLDSVNVKNQYLIEKARKESLASALEAQKNISTEQKELNLVSQEIDSEKYEQVGDPESGSGYYIDKQTNDVVLPKSTNKQTALSKLEEEEEAERQYRAERERERLATQSDDPALATNQQNSGNNQGSPSSQNNQGGTGNQGGGQNSNDVVAEEKQERQPDPDLPVIQQRLYDSYEQQMAEKERLDELLRQQKQASAERAKAIEKQRRQIASQAFQQQVGNIEQSVKQRSGGFSIKRYLPSEKQESQNNEQEQNVNEDLNSTTTGYQPIAYSSSNYNAYGYSDPLSNGAYSNHSPQKKDDVKRPELLPRHVIRAGTSWPIVVTKSVNTDEGLQVIAKVMDGPFRDSDVYGTIKPQGRDIGIQLTRIVPPNPREPIIPVNALALTLSGQKQSVSTDKENHYFQNYGVKTLTIAMSSYGESLDDREETTDVIIGDDGDVTTVTTTGPDDRSEGERFRSELMEELGRDLEAEIARLGNRPPTYYLRQGTVLQMKLLENMDTTKTADDIASSGSATLGRMRSSL